MSEKPQCIHISGEGGAWCVGDLRRFGIVPHTISIPDPVFEGGVNHRVEDWHPISVVDIEATAKVNDLKYEGISQDGTAHILSRGKGKGDDYLDHQQDDEKADYEGRIKEGGG